MVMPILEEIPAIDYRKLGITRERAHWMLRKMLEIRRFEEKVEELFLVKGALVGPSHLYLGQEAVATGVCSVIKQNDLLVTTYRCHGHALAKGVPARLVMAELFGKETGTCKGIGGSMHASIYPQVGSIYATAIVGSGVPIAAGMGLGLKHLREDRIAVCFLGDGALNTGAFHEGMNLAALWKLPVLFVCENNMYAMSTRFDRSVAGQVVDRARAYGIEARQVNGNDVVAVYWETQGAVEAIKHGNGPIFLECRTYKRKGHGVYDKAEYRPKEEVEEWLTWDPIERFAAKLKQLKLLTAHDESAMESQVTAEIEEAVSFAMNSPVLSFDSLAQHVYVM